MKTGYTFHETFLLHVKAGHPESPDRLRTILRLLKDSGMVEALQLIEAMPVSRELLDQVHARNHIELVRRISVAGRGRLDPDTYLNPASWAAASLAAGGAVGVTHAVLHGQTDNGFALVRPPGHHATPRHGMGFCLFNNVALAARAALNAGLERVLIVDFDVHHGNGTQDIFYDTSQVLFFSIHQSPLYPGTGLAEDIGVGGGEGYTVNVPLPVGVGDDGYLAIFEAVLIPIARRYAPQLILVSAGFDAHWADPLAGMRLSVNGFARLIRILRELAAELCGGRLVLVLEGGYNVDALSRAVLACFHVLHGVDRIDDPLGPSPQAVRELPEGLIEQLRRLHGVSDA